MPPKTAKTLGLLMSGGLDSSILLGLQLAAGRRVQPFYIRSNLCWQAPELAAAHDFLDALRGPLLEPLVVLDLPLDDLYGDHWSMTGRQVPAAGTADEAVYLPGRNALLILKAAVYCQLHGIDELALAVLHSNPFADATPEFFAALEASLARQAAEPLRLVRPLSDRSKAEVLRAGRDLPLHLTFSCIAPIDDRHCGRCNKCAERRDAFRQLELPDPTSYVESSSLPV